MRDLRSALLCADELHRLIADATRRCVELEGALAAALARGSDGCAADEALRSTQQLLLLYQAQLVRVERRANPEDPA